MLNLRLSPPLAGLVAVIAGGLAALGFEPVNLWPLTIIGVGILVALVDTAGSRRRAVLMGWLFGTGHFVAGLGWIATAFTFQSKMPPLLGWVTVVLLSMFLALYVAFAAGVTRSIAKEPLARVFALAALWMLGEWLRGWVLTGFSWNPLGAAWLTAPGVAQLAEFGGALWLSGLVVLAGGGLWLLVRPSGSNGQRLAGGGLGLFVVLSGVIGAGMVNSYYYPDSPEVFLVQPNIGQDVKYQQGAEEAHLQTYLDLTASALAAANGDAEGGVGKARDAEAALADFGELEAETNLPGAGSAATAKPGEANAAAAKPSEPKTAAAKPDEQKAPQPAAAAIESTTTSEALAGSRRGALIIWSESSVPYAVEEDPQVRARLAAVLGPADLLLFGGVAINRDASGNIASLTNSLFVLDAKGNLRGRYDKAHLVPLGEYVPARTLMTALGVARLAPGDLDFKPGPGPRTLALPGFPPAGVQICYEIIFPGAVIDAAKRPAWIVNISNDAWFGPSGPPQHLAQARLRAIEEGLPIARATPTGISALIDANGRIVVSQPPGEAGVVSAQLPPPLPATPFARFGHLVPAVLGILLIAAALGIDSASAKPKAEAEAPLPQPTVVPVIVDLPEAEPWTPQQPPRAPRVAQRRTPVHKPPPGARRDPPAD